MRQIIFYVTTRVHEDCHTTCPRCGVEVIARFTPKVTLDGAASAWTVDHRKPRCGDEILDRIDWASEDLVWTPVLPPGPLYIPHSRI